MGVVERHAGLVGGGILTDVELQGRGVAGNGGADGATQIPGIKQDGGGIGWQLHAIVAMSEAQVEAGSHAGHPSAVLLGAERELEMGGKLEHHGHGVVAEGRAELCVLLAAALEADYDGILGVVCVYHLNHQTVLRVGGHVEAGLGGLEDVVEVGHVDSGLILMARLRYYFCRQGFQRLLNLLPEGSAETLVEVVVEQHVLVDVLVEVVH